MTSKEEQFRRVEESFIELAKAFRLVSFYPPGHPQRRAVLDRVHSVLRANITPGGEMSLEFSKDGALWEKKPLGHKSDQGLSMGKEIFLRRVKAMRIPGGVSAKGISALLTALTIDQEDLEAQGGVGNFLRRQGVKDIFLQEIHYERLKEEARGERSEEAEELLEEGLEPIEEEPKTAVTDEDLTPEEKETARLLAEAEAEKDLGRYLELLKRIVKSCRKFVEAGRSEIPFRALQTLVAHSKDITKHDVQRRYAREAFVALGDSRTITLLIGRLATRPVYSSDDYAAVFTALEDKALSALIADLIARKELKARRRVSEMVVRFKDKAIPRILPLLKDGRWFVVRNMIALLGEIKADSAAGSLRECFHHPDIRVRKEAVKALSALRSPQAVRHLIDALQGEDRELASYCAFALEAMKEPSAVKPLMIVAKKSPSKELRREAISSLGKIGSQEAIPFFIKLMMRKGLRRFTVDADTQASAALALGEIGGLVSLRALEKGAVSHSRNLREACWKALEIIDERLGGA